jgi:hypothetical protein
MHPRRTPHSKLCFSAALRWCFGGGSCGSVSGLVGTEAGRDEWTLALGLFPGTVGVVFMDSVRVQGHVEEIFSSSHVYRNQNGQNGQNAFRVSCTGLASWINCGQWWSGSLVERPWFCINTANSRMMILYVGQKASRRWHESCERDGALCTSRKLRRLCRNRTVCINVFGRRLSHRLSRITILSPTSYASSPLFFAFNNMHSTILYQPPSKPFSSINMPNRIPTCY